jgi:hypothetical protein
MREFQSIGKLLITGGSVLVVIGLALTLLDRISWRYFNQVKKLYIIFPNNYFHNSKPNYFANILFVQEINYSKL